MTDGIIQQVFSPLIKYCLEFPKDKYTSENIAEGLREIEQELIEKIKQKFPEHRDNRHDTDHWNKCVHYVIKEIIGDSKE